MKSFFLLVFPNEQKCISAQYALKPYYCVTGKESIIDSKESIILFKKIEKLNLERLQEIFLTENPKVLLFSGDSFVLENFPDFLTDIKNGGDIKKHKSVFKSKNFDEIFLEIEEMVKDLTWK